MTALGAAALLSTTGAVAWVVHGLAADEHRFDRGAATLARLRSDARSTPLSAHLLDFEGRGTQRLDLVVCAERGSGRWSRRELVGLFDIVLWEPARSRLVQRSRLDGARVAAGGPEAAPCFPMIDTRLPDTGRYSVELAWPGDDPEPVLSAARVAARAVTWRSLAPTDVLPVFLLGLLLLGAVAGVGATAPPATQPHAGMTPARAAAATVVALAALEAQALGGGPSGQVVAACLLQVLVAGVVFLLAAPADRWRTLGLTRPRRPLWLLAPACGLVIGVGAAQLPRLLPGSGESVVEHALALPSGRLATAALALLAPFGEELVFRGVLYSAFARLGRGWAVLLSSVLFAAAHLPQLHGAHGALLAVCAAAVGFGLLRALSGSLWAPLAAHLTYNASLVALGLWGVLSRPP